MSDEVRKLIETADDLPFQERWKVVSLLTSAARISQYCGTGLMKDLAEYFAERQPAKSVAIAKMGNFECEHCKRKFETQQALVGHGPRRCKENKKMG